ncbi:hypothetical protein M427DRAFT_52296 [Gonapodya prolifera JEL478]|uniref:F-box domain-containing protein n=1 Tax=Gonapodya prolifera (strain JEL478) TaxID=1344416 RepID=A0A139ATG4_GONPJ|nr:hypothetical protein M427DRAFT_52296 [Gonapodya prolifera JEL478]|eukprot:KXS20021.1 hypothetical protein M427DRAFT_52296 [Gonapodya prolifera JEL478]
MTQKVPIGNPALLLERQSGVLDSIPRELLLPIVSFADPRDYAQLLLASKALHRHLAPVSAVRRYFMTRFGSAAALYYALISLPSNLITRDLIRALLVTPGTKKHRGTTTFPVQRCVMQYAHLRQCASFNVPPLASTSSDSHTENATTISQPVTESDTDHVSPQLFVPWPVYALLLRLSLGTVSWLSGNHSQATSSTVPSDADLALRPRVSPLMLRLAISLDELHEEIEKNSVPAPSDDEGARKIDWATGRRRTVDQAERKLASIEGRLATAMGDIAINNSHVMFPAHPLPSTADENLFHRLSRLHPLTPFLDPFVCNLAPQSAFLAVGATLGVQSASEPRSPALAHLLDLILRRSFVPAVVPPHKLVRSCCDILANYGPGVLDLIVRRGLDLRQFNVGWEAGEDLWTQSAAGVGRVRYGSDLQNPDSAHLDATIEGLAQRFGVSDRDSLVPPPQPPRAATYITKARYTVRHVLVPLARLGVNFSTQHAHRVMLRSIAGRSTQAEVAGLLEDFEQAGWTLRGLEGKDAWMSLVGMVLERWYDEPAAQALARRIDDGWGRSFAGDPTVSGWKRGRARIIQQARIDSDRRRHGVEMLPPHVILSNEGALRIGIWASSVGTGRDNGASDDTSTDHAPQWDPSAPTELRKWIRYPVLVVRFPLAQADSGAIGYPSRDKDLKVAAMELLEAMRDYLVKLELDTVSPTLVGSILQEMAKIECEFVGFIESTEDAEDDPNPPMGSMEGTWSVRVSSAKNLFVEDTALSLISKSSENGVAVPNRVLDTIMAFVSEQEERPDLLPPAPCGHQLLTSDEVASIA